MALNGLADMKQAVLGRGAPVNRLLIVGDGGQSKVARDIWVDCWGNEALVVPAFTGREILELGLQHDCACVFVAVADNAHRARLISEALAAGLPEYRLQSLVHPKASLAKSARLGIGSIVMAGAVVGPSAWVMDGSVVNHGATVDHDCLVHKNAWLSPGVHLAGGVTVRKGAFLGVGASVAPGVNIGSNATIGAGAVVLQDIPEGAVAYGVPARIIRIEPLRETA
jgi:sugar O-acyltransferase (sialic acid O-acetyltransferase NeuD family)